jgi:hypothetical protein
VKYASTERKYQVTLMEYYFWNELWKRNEAEIHNLVVPRFSIKIIQWNKQKNFFSSFRVCKSAHHRTFKLNQPTRCSKFSSVLLVISVLLNMFRASSCPSSRATTTAVAASGLPSECGGSSAVGRGRAGRPAWPRPTALLPPRSDDKPEAATAVVVAPDYGHKDARNMLSCI